jgi:hypothetical protein
MLTSIKPWLYLGALLLSIAMVFAAYQSGRSDSNSEWELSQARLKAEQEAAARETERNWLSKMEKLQNDAEHQISAARSDAAAAVNVADGLHKQAAAYASRLSKCSSAAGRSETAGSGAALLAELFERADRRAGELAEALDRSRIAGEACRVAYENIRGKN